MYDTVKAYQLYDLLRLKFPDLINYEIGMGADTGDNMLIGVTLPDDYNLTPYQDMLGAKYTDRLEVNFHKDNIDYMQVRAILTPSELNIVINYLQNL